MREQPIARFRLTSAVPANRQSSPALAPFSTTTTQQLLKMSGRRLYIGRVSQDATRQDLQSYFGTHGPIVDVRLMGGFAFLEFEELKDAEQAQGDFNGKEFMGDRLVVH